MKEGMMEIAGCTAVVTGAGRGIGRAFVAGLLDAGAARVLAGVRGDFEPWDDPRVAPVPLEITDPAQVAAVAAAEPGVSLLVNNAAVEGRAGLLAAPDLDEARRQMEVNYWGSLGTIRAFAPAIARRRGGIVQVLSLAALANIPAVGSYSASKAAAASMVQGVRAELARHGVQVMAVHPAAYDTDMAAGFTGHKNPPSLLVDAVLKGLREGGPDDLFPDAEAQALGALSQAELRGVFGALLPDVDYALTV